LLRVILFVVLPWFFSIALLKVFEHFVLFFGGKFQITITLIALFLLFSALKLLLAFLQPEALPSHRAL